MIWLKHMATTPRGNRCRYLTSWGLWTQNNGTNVKLGTREGKCSQPLKQVFRQYKITLRNIAECFYSIRVLFTLYLVQLDNNELYLRSSENKAWKKIQTCTGFEPMTSTIPVQRFTNWANKPTGNTT